MFNEDIARLISPLIKQASAARLQPVADPERIPIVSSHFGGRPYAESGESWPVCPECARPLSFICQFNLAECVHEALPGVGLFTFFYCWGCFREYAVRLHPNPSREKAITIPGSQETKSCTVTMKAVKSLPDWEGIDRWCRQASEISVRANPEEPWEPYDSTAEQLTGQTDYATMIGGYPRWVQGDDTPKCPQCGRYMELLAQVDSEKAAGIMWGDVGSVYLFICSEHLSEIQLAQQCF